MGKVTAFMEKQCYFCMEFALREQASWMLHISLKRCGPGKIAMADGKNNVGREKN